MARNVTLAEVAHVVDRPRSTVDNWSLNRLRTAPPFPEAAVVHGSVKFYAWADIKVWLREAGQPIVNKLPN